MYKSLPFLATLFLTRYTTNSKAHEEKSDEKYEYLLEK